MYWNERQKQLYAGLEKDEAALKRRLAAYYSEEAARLDREIAAYYQKYGENGIIKYRTLKESLSDDEVKLLMQDCDEFVKKYPQYAGLMPIRKSIYKLDRLEGLQYSIMLHQYGIGALTQIELNSHFRKQALKGVNFAREILGFGKNFHTANDDVINLFVGVPWANGKSFSQTIWENSDKLINYLQYDFAAGIARGDSYSRLTKALQERFITVNKNDAYRLVYTEGTYVMAEATMQPFKEEFEQYKLSTVGDGKVCSKCADIARQVFDIKDRTPGVNFPPMHPWCRCTFEIYVEDWDKWQDDYVARHGQAPDKILQSFRQNSNMINNSSKLLNHPVTQESIDNVPFIKFDEFSDAQNTFIYNERKRLLQSLMNCPTGQENSLIVQFDELIPHLINDGDIGTTKYESIGKSYYAMHNHPECDILSPKDLMILCNEPFMYAVEALANNGKNTSIVVKTINSDVDGYFLYISKKIEKYRNKYDEEYIRKHIDKFLKISEEVLNAAEKFGFKIIRR